MALHNNISYFDPLLGGFECPAGVELCFDDVSAYRIFPEHRHVYNKLFVAESQDVRSAPHQIRPDVFPVFEKPIINLMGMGRCARLVKSPGEYEPTPGLMWSEVLRGSHISTDVVVWKGEPVWFGHLWGQPGPRGTFKYWKALPRKTELDTRLGEWIKGHLSGYTGLLNLETIGGTIIEAHLRVSPSSLPFFGDRWLESVACALQTGLWSGIDDPYEGYIIPVFTDEYRPHTVKPRINRLSGLWVLPTLENGMPDKGPEYRKALIYTRDLARGIEAKPLIDQWID